MSLSKRAKKLTEGTQPLVQAHFKCSENPWHETINADGYINLGTAENHLVYDLLEPVLNQPPKLKEHHTHYDILYGAESFRNTLAQYLVSLTGTEVDAGQIVVASGSSAIVEMLMYALCDAGEGVIIPTPYYAGFDHDLKTRAGVEPVPLHLKPEKNFAITADALQDALIQAKKREIKIKAILLTSPNNPLGRVYDEQTLALVMRFAKEQKLELIVDELYAQSVFGDKPYLSAWKMAKKEKMNIHIVYGFAKDFGLSGFKTGILYSNNELILKAMRELSYFAPVSTSTQAMLTRLLQDAGFTAHFFDENRKRLKTAWQVCKNELAKAEIPFTEADAGFFVWLDLRKWLKHDDESSEMLLFQELMNQAKVNISPGQVFRSVEPGFFRLCYARPETMIQEAVKRLHVFFGSKKNE
jgi:aspartate/methionine/tyrosine aminotransferase